MTKRLLMSDTPPFAPPEVTDDDICWASNLLNLPKDAFHGKDGSDPRQAVLKSLEEMDVAACPGSGKTTLLVAKLAILAEKWRDNTRGLCVLSHTNAARKEIETKLGNTTAGRRLLSYPHFIGTIHGFVNEFLAIPLLRSRGYQIKMIDTDLSQKRRWLALPPNTRAGLETNGYGPPILSVKSPDFGIGPVCWGKKRTPLRSDTDTYKKIRDVCRQSSMDGYFCYDEMFVWAGDLMDKVPGVVEVLRNRFPLLFIDEAQDNTEDQSAILHRIFLGGGGTVIRQRFGDANQAIFNFVGYKGAESDFPDDRIKTIDLPTSHRFGQTIADLADPLALVPHSLKGRGPKTPLKSGAQEGLHTIFLFDDNNATNVLDAYGELLLGIFSEEELSEGSRKGMFVAIGQIHKDNGDDQRPRHVGHYWPDYDPELARADPKPSTFVEYVFAGMGEAEKVSQSHPAVEKIAKGILRLAAMAEGGRIVHDRRYCHRYLLRLLEGDAKARKGYDKVLDRFAIRREAPTEEMWDEGRCRIVREIAESIAKASLSGDEVTAFLSWPERQSVPTVSSTTRKSRDNIYSYPNGSPKVQIRVGSIHSVKGQTHTATLVLETFWQDHNLQQLKRWIVRPTMEKGWKKSDGVEQKKRLKIHYVAMTRPTHLLCLAMKRSTFVKDGSIDLEMIRELEERGWQIRCV